MQVTEVTNEGLTRAYKVVVSAEEIETRINERLKKMGKKAKIPGFRPGKAPLSLMKRQYGRSVMGEVLEKAVHESSQKTISDHDLKPALQPKIEVTSFDEGKDLEFSMDLEVLPAVPEIDIAGIELVRQVTAVSDDTVQESIDRLAKSKKEYAEPETARPAQEGDRITLDFTGKVDGEEFEGGKAEDHELELGSNSMIPGFEDQLVGVSAGDEKTITVTFPEQYHAENLAGKEATFDCRIKKIEAPQDVAIDDEFAKSFGVDDLEALKAAIKERLESDYAGMSRSKLKRALLDKLAETVSFEVPKGMLDVEFDAIWKQLTEEMDRNDQKFEESEGGEDGAREEYRGIAERRVRLGLLLSEIGTRNDIKVEQEELQRALIEQARRYPGQEKQVFEYFQKTPGAIEQLRAPLFEDKVVDHIFEHAKIEDLTVPLEELLRDPDEEPAEKAEKGD